MNYMSHYERLIERARDRVLDGYKERHHVFPWCMGGTNAPENLVDLTAEEHYVAHQLLVKIHPKHFWLAYAAVRMSKQCTGNKPYGWLRRRHAADIMGTKGAHTGYRHTDDARAKMSASRSGKPLTAAQRAARAGRKLSLSHRANLGAARVGHQVSEETRHKIASSNLGKKRSAETRAKLSTARRKRVTTAETRAKMSASQKGRKLGPKPSEIRAKLSAALKAAWASGKARNQWTAP